MMFRLTIDEEFNGVIPPIVIDKAHSLIKKITEAEKRWLLYVTNGMLGFTEQSISIFVENAADSICKNLKLPKIYNRTEHDFLGIMLKDRLKGGEKESRSNFFEVNATEYSKGSVIQDYD